jgi:hypothetical protein
MRSLGFGLLARKRREVAAVARWARPGAVSIKYVHSALISQWRKRAQCARGPFGLHGSTFLAQGSRRQRLLLGNDDFGSARDLRDWLHGAGLTDVSVDREDGLVVFAATRL